MFRFRIRNLREAAGYKSQYAFAQAFGVAQSTVAGWEGGKREPNYATTIRLADFFGVSVDYLLGHTDTKDSAPHSDGLSEIERLFLSLPPERREEVLRFMEYQASQASGK